MVRVVRLWMVSNVLTNKQTSTIKIPLSMEMVLVDPVVYSFRNFSIYFVCKILLYCEILTHYFECRKIKYMVLSSGLSFISLTKPCKKEKCTLFNFLLLRMEVYIEPPTTSTKLCFSTPLGLHWWTMQVFQTLCMILYL